jgi:hypothetical protein
MDSAPPDLHDIRFTTPGRNQVACEYFDEHEWEYRNAIAYDRDCQDCQDCQKVPREGTRFRFCGKALCRVVQCADCAERDDRFAAQIIRERMQEEMSEEDEDDEDDGESSDLSTVPDEDEMQRRAAEVFLNAEEDEEPGATMKEGLSLVQRMRCRKEAWGSSRVGVGRLVLHSAGGTVDRRFIHTNRLAPIEEGVDGDTVMTDADEVDAAFERADEDARD